MNWFRINCDFGHCGTAGQKYDGVFFIYEESAVHALRRYKYIKCIRGQRFYKIEPLTDEESAELEKRIQSNSNLSPAQARDRGYYPKPTRAHRISVARRF